MNKAKKFFPRTEIQLGPDPLDQIVELFPGPAVPDPGSYAETP